ncbi:MAG: hypothetical protein IPK87_05435 [Planctomycetes bacterium]|nr:hypothetical protein [Planctomycetota bacterium]
MADKASGDWTAGIIAMFAALLIGGGIPVGLYLGLYAPKKQERIDAEKKYNELVSNEMVLLAQQADVMKLKAEADEMAERVKEIEAPFAVGSDARVDVPAARDALKLLAERHNLKLLPIRRQQAGAEVVFPGEAQVTFEKGLVATKLIIEAQATFHDFGRFVTEMEMLSNLVVIPATLDCQGDSNGGREHLFVMHVFVVQKRDVEVIGK